AAFYYFCHPIADWKSADRSSAGLLPRATPETGAVVRIFSARTIRWRGIVATHSWIVIKESGAGTYSRLMGRIFDDRGNRMTPSHSRKGAARHRYYFSSALIQGKPEIAGSVARVPAAKIEAFIVETLRQHLGPNAPSDDAELITTTVGQIE